MFLTTCLTPTLYFLKTIIFLETQEPGTTSIDNLLILRLTQMKMNVLQSPDLHIILQRTHTVTLVMGIGVEIILTMTEFHQTEVKEQHGEFTLLEGNLTTTKEKPLAEDKLV